MIGRWAAVAGAATIAASAALLLSSPPIANAAPSALTTDATPATSTVTVPMPGPGHSSDWSGSIANPGADAVNAYLTVTAVGGSTAEFGDLLTATVTHPSGRVVLPETPVADLLDGAPIDLGSVAAGSTVTLSGTVALARSAGDELQGRGASIVFQLTSVEKAPEPPVALPDTGSTIAVAAIVVAAIAIVGGGLLLLARRKKGSQ
ncbi:hypothetical protein GCM10027406_07400 [Leifsonia lichenia]